MTLTRLRNLFVGTLLSAIVIPLSACAANDQEAAVARISESLQKSDRVNFYFLTRTDVLDASVEEIIRDSSVKIERQCGANCLNFMSEVVEHLRDSTPKPCLKGDEDLAIIIPGSPALVYSYNGRHIKFMGRCYSNSRSINEIVQRSSFIF